MRWFSRAVVVAFVGALLLSWTPTASAQRGRVVIVQPVPVWLGPGPFWYPGYPYGYPPSYIAENYGFVKINKHHLDKNDSVYVDKGYAAKLKDGNKFALRPGNHDIELRDTRGQTIFQERVAVTLGKTTKVEVPS
jgi:hypothetical protein